jgi:hypothetical protein
MDISVPIVAYIFVCIIYPRLVKNKPQFYMAFAVLLLILVLDVFINLAGGPVAAAVGGISRFLVVLRSVLFIVDFILLVLATGGLSLHELTGELKGAYEIMRRGEDTKTVIIPLTGQMPKSKEEAAAERAARAAQAAATPKKDEGERSIPLD